MVKFIIKRVFYMIIAFLAVSLVTLFLMRAAPGSFLELDTFVGGIAAGTSQYLSPDLIKSLTAQYHLNSPWYVQDWGYVWSFITLHFGYSIEYPTVPTMDMLRRVFPISFGLAMISVAVGVILSVISGVVAAVRANTWVDSTTMLVATLGTAVPEYVIAVILMLVFGVWIRLFPVVGFQGPQYYVLPILSLALPMVGGLSRYMRNSIIESLNSEYIVTVYAKGGGLREVIFGHAMRNSLLPLITVVGPRLATLFMGTVLIEQMFGIPGMGQMFVQAASRRDYPLIMDSTLIYAVIIMGMNLLVDIIYGFLDPRIRKTGYAEGR